MSFGYLYVGDSDNNLIDLFFYGLDITADELGQDNIIILLS